MHIKSVQELVSYLSNLQEGATEDPLKAAYFEQLESDKENYKIEKVNSKKSQTEEAEEVDVEEEEIESKPSSAATRSSEITPTLDNLIRNINDLRSGESLKRAEIRDEVADYFDGLDEDEQAVLVLFLRELAAVVTKSKSGSQAADPSDKPNDFVIKKSKSSPEKSEETPAPKAKPTQVAKKSSASVEDDSAPIRVDEAQDFTNLKNKLKILRGIHE
jgi:hypothetical protein